MHLAVVDDLLPVRVLTLQLVSKMDLLRRYEAQRRVIYREIADQRRQAQPTGCIVSLAVRLDLLDVDRRRKLVDGNVTWIDDVDAVEWQEPQFSIGGLGDARSVFACGDGTKADAVGTIECCTLNDPLRIGRPRI
jgi:hypothetical protein